MTTMQAIACEMPTEVALKLASFLRDGRTGEMILDIKNGRILGWKITETGRVHEPKP